jgi:peroxiredoxin
MNKIFSMIFFCLCCFSGLAQKKAINHQFTLNGTIKGTMVGTVYFCYIDAREKFHVDSADLDHGHFHFRGLVNGPTIAFVGTVKKSLPEEDDDIMKTDGKNSSLFFLEPKAMKAELETGDFRNGIFTGSLSQTQYTQYNHKLSLITDQYKAENDSSQALTTMDKAQKEEARTRFASIRDAAENRVLHAFLSTHPQSYVTAYLVSISHFKLDSLNLFYHRLPPSVKQSACGRDIQEKIERKKLIAIGKTAPLFKQGTRAGDTVAIKNLRGKYVLLEFWSSTNNASRAENRALIPVYNQFKVKNFTILGISLDGRKTKAIWAAAIEKDQLPWTQLAALKSNHNQAVQEYDVQSVPANFLIGPTGKILATDLKAKQLNQLLTKIAK